MQQITVSGVQFNQIETGFTRIGDSLAEIIDNSRDFIGFQRAWHRGIHSDSLTIFITQGSTGPGADSGCGYRRLSTRLQAGVRNTACVP